MRNVALLACAAGALSLLASSTAIAEETKGKEFGDQGVIAIGAATSLDLSYTSTSPPSGSGSNTIHIGIEPEVQYFVINALSVGGVVAFDWAQASASGGSSASASTTTFGIGPTVGYNVWLKPSLLSLWPQAEFLFSNVNAAASGSGVASIPSTTNTVMTVGLFVPLLIHPVEHFHFGIGPYFDIDVSSKTSSGSSSADGDKNTVFGLKGEIAGWL
jgi:hypothetical protein